jgi:two-component system chemotaxis response regulator CheB
MSRIARSIRDARSDAAMAVIVVSASAGALEPLRSFVRGIPADIPAAVVIAQHVAERSWLPEILTADARVPVGFARSGVRLRQGSVYVCPAQTHVVVNPDATLTLSRRERVRFVRPNGDWLFASAAASFGERAFAIVMSGLQDDGARGCVAIRKAGGTVIAQDPGSCARPEMPRAAIATGAVNFVLAPGHIPIVLTQLLATLDLEQCRANWNEPFLRSGLAS